MLEQSRVRSDPELTDDAEVYEVVEPDGRPGSNPVVYRVDVTVPSAVILSARQRAELGDYEAEMFIELESLVKLGKIAESLIELRKADA